MTHTNYTAHIPGCPAVATGPLVTLSEVEKGIAIWLYTTVGSMALVGNGLIIFIICRFKQMHATTNMFILNLALADILMASLCMPFSYWPVLIMHGWVFGLPICVLSSHFKAFAVLLSAHTLAVISIDRLWAVFFPLRKKLGFRMALMLISVLWFLDTVQAFPMGFYSALVDDNSTGTVVYQCTENFPTRAGPEIMSYYLMLSQYFIPVVVLITTYVAIGYRLTTSGIPRELGQLTQEKSRRRSNRKVIRMLLAVSVTYSFCWLPLNSLNILYGRCPDVLNFTHILYVWWCCHFLAMCQSCINPIIYVISSKRFREGFCYVFRWVPGIRFEPKELVKNASTYAPVAGSRVNSSGNITDRRRSSASTRTNCSVRKSSNLLDYGSSAVSGRSLITSTSRTNRSSLTQPVGQRMCVQVPTILEVEQTSDIDTGNSPMQNAKLLVDTLSSPNTDESRLSSDTKTPVTVGRNGHSHDNIFEC